MSILSQFRRVPPGLALPPPEPDMTVEPETTHREPIHPAAMLYSILKGEQDKAKERGWALDDCEWVMTREMYRWIQELFPSADYYRARFLQSLSEPTRRWVADSFPAGSAEYTPPSVDPPAGRVWVMDGIYVRFANVRGIRIQLREDPA